MHLFLISLPEPSLRRRSAIDKLNPTGLRFEIVDGVEARKWRDSELPIAENAWRGLSAGQVGCYLAHLCALRRLVDYELNWACILEDDFCFEANPSLGLADLEANLPVDFHYIHLQRDLGLNADLQRAERCGPFERILGTPLCSAGYVITRPLAEHVLGNHAEVVMPIDHLY